jgi:hypothetical protein
MPRAVAHLMRLHPKAELLPADMVRQQTDMAVLRTDMARLRTDMVRSPAGIAAKNSAGPAAAMIAQSAASRRQRR